jgi:hypothetical protein
LSSHNFSFDYYQFFGQFNQTLQEYHFNTFLSLRLSDHALTVALYGLGVNGGSGGVVGFSGAVITMA